MQVIFDSKGQALYAVHGVFSVPDGCVLVNVADAMAPVFHRLMLADGVVEVLEDDLSAMRDRAMSRLPEWEKSERSAGIEHAGQRWLTTPLALQDIRDVLLAGSVPNEQWVTADRKIVPMSLPELQLLWQAITARGAAIYQHRLEMEQQVAGMNREQLEAFVPGWA
ncbi:DUF4376 domain-containing protein [Laribacter hongkongensis]|uniref:DUF4376 domain-containing protein n=1 Tax=Laribacter hongkongensis TaxID=168471 RepID=UPI00358DC87E